MAGEPMTEGQRASEQERRNAAQAAAGSGVEPGAHEVPARRISQMMSVRMEPELIRGLRRVAASKGMSVSDLLRDAAVQLVEAAERQSVLLEVKSTSALALTTKVEVHYWDGTRVHPSNVYPRTYTPTTLVSA
jgi:predicted HicB family RNase H-like nuclease